jgi:anti-sigma-K factor RskA
VILQRSELHTVTGVYALDAVEGAEKERFSKHARRCQSCAAEVRGMRTAAARLAMATARQPPARMREHVMSAVDRTRQVPPIASERRTRPDRGRSWRLRLSVAAAAAGVAAAAVFGVTDAVTQHRLDAAQARSHALAAVLAAPDAHLETGVSATGGTVTAVASRQRGEMVVSTSGLPPLPAAKVYQVWLMGPPSTRSAGLLPSPQAGRTQPVLASGVKPADRVGITVEPAGGTSTPTTGPIITMALPG